MGLSRVMLRALTHARYSQPTPIQAAFIPQALDGLDVIGQAKTGTGKTAAFGIPLIEMMEARGRGPQAIILAPTRELVQQIVGELQKLSRRRGTSPSAGSTAASRSSGSSGPSAEGSTSSSARPGRVLDHMERRTLYLGDIVHVVLDEADRMLDIGFRPDIERILRKVPNPHQTLLLSATISDDVRKLAQRYMYEADRGQPVAGRALGRDDPAVLRLGEPRPEGRAAGSSAEARPAAAVHRLHANQARGRPAGRAVAAGGARGRLDPRRPAPVRPRPGDARASATAPSRFWSPPTSSAAASMSRASATSSTTTSPTIPRTTSTGSAGPAGWARTASPTCSSGPTRASR